jgi:soluble lytic murein transglycosylase-like protein
MSGAERDRRGSPPEVGERLWEWEHPGSPAWRARAARFWRRHRLRAGAVAVGVLVFGLAAAVAGTGEQASDGGLLQHRLRRAEQTLTARQGELALVRLEMTRLRAVVAYSAKHGIPADLAADIHDIALAEGIDPALAYSLVRVESGFRRTAISPKGAVGLTQLMPSTAVFVEPGIGYEDLFDRRTNLRIGFRYLRRLIDQYDGDVPLALLAYNRGPTRVDEIRQMGGDPNNGYSGAVLGAQ